MKEIATIIWRVFSKLIGFIIFFILLAVANVLTAFTNSAIFNDIVNLLNKNIGLIMLIALFFLFAEVFELLDFPWNLPAPLFMAAGSVFFFTFFLEIFKFIDQIIGKNIFSIFQKFSFLIYPLIFVIVLVAGYIGIINDMSKKGKQKKSKKR